MPSEPTQAEPMRLTIRSGDARGTTATVNGGRILIGRADDCDLTVPDGKVSRHHAAVEGSPTAGLAQRPGLDQRHLPERPEGRVGRDRRPGADPGRGHRADLHARRGHPRRDDLRRVRVQDAVRDTPTGRPALRASRDGHQRAGGSGRRATRRPDRDRRAVLRRQLGRRRPARDPVGRVVDRRDPGPRRHRNRCGRHGLGARRPARA